MEKMDACGTLRKDWEELDPTKEELDNLNDCLKKEEFRKLLIEYANEVTDPNNRKIYQNEIRELEKERGIDVSFVNPEPGYVIKTSINGDKKCFINISKCEIVGKPTSQPSMDNGHRGLQWSIPYTLSPSRDDLDKSNQQCTVYDVVFHPDTLYLASKNPRFRDIVNNTALDGVENTFRVKLDRKNLKFPKINFKGISQSTVIRKKSDKPVEKQLDLEPEIYQKIMSNYDDTRKRQSTLIENQANNKGKHKKSSSSVTTYYKNKSKVNEDDDDPNYTTPKFIIKHQSDIDIQDFRNSKDTKLNAAIPKNLVIIIDLPLLRSSNDCVLDVQERFLKVVSEKPAKYRLELPLPYRVNLNGHAKFDTSKKTLTVTLPVIRNVSNKISYSKDDSGVESDHSSPTLESIIQNNNSNVNHHLNHLIDDDDHHNKSLLINGNSNSIINEITKSQISCDNNVEEETAMVDVDDDEKSLEDIETYEEEPFMNVNIMYSLPHFSCNIYDNNLALTIHVKNVDSSSIRYKLIKQNAGIHITLASVGAGFFPVYYALCLKIKNDALKPDTINVEPWDNNVVFSIGLNNITDDVTHYYVGLNKDFMEAKDLPHNICLQNKIESLKSDTTDNSENNDNKKIIEVLTNGEQVVVNINSEDSHADSDDDDDDDDDGDEDDDEDGGDREGDYNQSYSKNKNKTDKMKCRSVSESSGDELASSNGSSCRGILKYRRNTFSRSVSESSIDDATGLLLSIDLNDDSVPESDSSSLKKTVRFNDVVSRKLFRSNSSILGRRRKNQRKLRKKKEAHERRMSESENSETESKIDNKKLSDKTGNNTIINRDKSSTQIQSNNIRDNNDKLHNNIINSDQKTEFKNDLIFDLDI